MRPESLAYARAQIGTGRNVTARALAREPIRIDRWPDGTRQLTDGRHRLAAAQEAGARLIRVREVVRGPRGGERSSRVRVMRIDRSEGVFRA